MGGTIFIHLEGGEMFFYNLLFNLEKNDFHHYYKFLS